MQAVTDFAAAARSKLGKAAAVYKVSLDVIQRSWASCLASGIPHRVY